jgi:hypothetical protein
MIVLSACFFGPILIKWTFDYEENKKSKFGTAADAAQIYT